MNKITVVCHKDHEKGYEDYAGKCLLCEVEALAQPKWIGLTDEELLESYGWIPAPGAPDFILNGAKQELLSALRKVEAKLKEKNNAA